MLINGQRKNPATTVGTPSKKKKPACVAGTVYVTTLVVKTFANEQWQTEASSRIASSKAFREKSPTIISIPEILSMDSDRFLPPPCESYRRKRNRPVLLGRSHATMLMSKPLAKRAVAGTQDRSKSHSIQQCFPEKVSCNYVGAGNLEQEQKTKASSLMVSSIAFRKSLLQLR